MTLSRRATDRGEPSNAQVLVEIERMEKVLTDFIAEDRIWHGQMERRLDEDERQALLRQDWIDRNAPEVQAFHDFRVEILMLGKMLRWATGGSIIAAMAALASLILMLGHLVNP